MVGKSKWVALFFASMMLVHCGANDPAPPRSHPTPVDDAGSEAGYPEGPYGVSNGQVIANLSWEGWREPKQSGFEPSAFERISLGDFFDPDGEKGFRAIFVNASARWCSICKMEQRHIREKRDVWGPRGVVFLETLFENTGSGPATPSDLVAWGNTYQIDWILVLDPTNKLSSFFDRSASPMNMIIDARTMVIRDIITGMPDESWWAHHLEPLMTP